MIFLNRNDLNQLFQIIKDINDISDAYNYLVQKIMSVAPIIKRQVKGNSQEQFDKVIADEIKNRVNHSKNFKCQNYTLKN